MERKTTMLTWQTTPFTNFEVVNSKKKKKKKKSAPTPTISFGEYLQTSYVKVNNVVS